jgi:hypothetical protein
MPQKTAELVRSLLEGSLPQTLPAREIRWFVDLNRTIGAPANTFSSITSGPTSVTEDTVLFRIRNV